jgi:transcriptional regulator with XRE-family HTH domain
MVTRLPPSLMRAEHSIGGAHDRAGTCDFRMTAPISREDLGAAIAAARTEAGLTQEELGELTGLGQTALSRIESGHRRIDSIELLAIARALSVDLGDLLASAKARGDAPDPADDAELIALRLGDRGPAAANALGWVREFLDRLARLEELNRA